MAILGLIPGERGTTEPIQTGFIDGSPIDAPPLNLSVIGVVTAGAVTRPSTTTMPEVTTGPPLRHFMDLFYFRIWMIPHILDAQNPQLNTPIPFSIWNSYLEAVTLNTITPVNADGLTLDVAEGDVLESLELVNTSVTITEDAPNSIDALFNFTFSEGEASLRFLAELADILPIDADVGIQEKYEWLTDILPNYDGTEQRIALRARPRRSFVLNLTLLNDADRKVLYDKIYKTIALSVIVPAYQYQSQLKVATVIGDNKIFCNTARADLRAGESVILATRDGKFFFYRIDSVASDHVVISTAFSQVIPTRGTRVVGGFTGRMPDNTSLGMQSIAGQASITVVINDSREQIAYPDYEIDLPLMGSTPMLLRNPLADANAPEAFNAGLEVIDNQTGKPAQYTAWDQRYVSGTRSYLINGLFNKDEMQYWRTFLDYCRGQQRVFYTPTYRQDLVQVEGSDFFVSQMEVVGSEYATQYFTSPTYKHLQIETDTAGTFEIEVSNVENNGDSTTIHFASPIDADLTGVTAARISYLLLTRLGSDSVTLTHQDTYSTIDLALRTVKV